MSRVYDVLPDSPTPLPTIPARPPTGYTLHLARRSCVSGCAKPTCPFRRHASDTFCTSSAGRSRSPPSPSSSSSSSSSSPPPPPPPPPPHPPRPHPPPHQPPIHFLPVLWPPFPSPFFRCRSCACMSWSRIVHSILIPSNNRGRTTTSGRRTREGPV
ncbi:hypothetical protein M433DRAFT_187929 [Acidomyces richmondensis BFW]|nr:hypothetical protein M433DRAFT_187929 [Acidomyces richmondensis BFW]